ncbi:MAG: hypothetical protein EOP11_10730 [Proteobacteria bacterium]|nr:MAG: hypothetical protein EOP11_10730 [Pseudomonadota bacterium]
MPTIFVLAGFLLAATPAFAHPSELAIHTMEELCQGGRAEGSYELKLAGAGVLRLHLLCTAPGALIATGFVEPDGEPFSLIHAAIDGDTISFVSFHPGADEAPSMGGIGGPMVRLRFSLSSLGASQIKGTYQGPQTKFPLRVAGARAEAFPPCGGGAPGPSAEGYYEITQAPAKGSLKIGGVIGLEVIGGIQRIFLIGGEDFGASLYNGLAGEVAGNSFCASVGIDDDEHGRGPILGVRGTLGKEGEINFSYFSTRHGMQGSFIAKRH